MSFVERYLAPRPAAPPATWESITPLLQRRKKADGTYEFRPTPSFESPEPTGTSKPKPSTLRTLSDLGSETLGSIPARMREGWAGMTEAVVGGVGKGVEAVAEFPGMLQQAAMASLPEAEYPRAPAMDLIDPSDPSRMWGERGSSVREWRETVRDERAAATERLADVVTAGNLPPAAGAWLDTGAELASAIADPTNFIPAGAAVKAGSKVGKPLSFVEDFLPEVASRRLPLDDSVHELAEKSLAIGEGVPLPAPGILDAMSHAGSDVSPEAISRVARGEKYYRLLPDGTPVPIINDVGVVDVRPGPGQAKIRVAADGTVNVEEGAINAAQQRSMDRLAEQAPPPPRSFVEEAALDLGGGVDDDAFLASMGVRKGPGPPPRMPIRDVPDPITVPLVDFEAALPTQPGVARAIHRQATEQAVQAGERVRPGTLDAYPDLTAEMAVPAGAAGAINPQAGFVKLPAGPSFLERLFRHDGEFSSFGDLKGYAFERTKDYRQEIAAGQRSIKTTMRDFSSAFEDEVLRSPDFKGQKPDDVLRYITEGVEGKNDLTGIPPRLRSVAQSMRDHVDLQSDGYLALYGTDLPKSLREAIETNKGTYLGKTFAAFEDPDWPRLVDPLNPRHDPQERWRWDGYMDWAKKQRDDAAAAPLYRGAAVRTSAGDLGQVTAFDPATATATVTVTDADGAVSSIDFPRQDLHNLADNIGSGWTDDNLTAYGQRLLYRDPDAFFGVGQSAVGRESRGNLKKRILQDPRVDDLPTDLATKVTNGQLSLPTAIEQAKTRDGWWSQYLAHAPGLPEELDDLLGLHRDPSMRYRTSQMRAIHDQATFKLHRDLAEKGQDTLFFDGPAGAPNHFTKIGGKGPLAEKFTSPEIAAVIRGTENISYEQYPLMVKVLLNAVGGGKLGGFIKLGKTAGNFPAGPMRNLLAWQPQLLAGGHFVAAFNPARPIQLMAYQVADKLGTKRGALARLGKRMADVVELADGTHLGERWSMHLDELMPEIEFLYRKGIFGESAGASDLRHYAGAAPAKREPGAISAIRKGIRAPVEAGINFWAGGDDLGRHVYFRAELQNEAWAEGLLPASKTIPADYFTRPEWKDVIDAAAKRTALTTPTHSMIAPGIKALRDAPIAPFPGWTAEVLRNSKEQVKLGIADLRSPNPKRKALGAKRLSGFVAASAMAGGGLTWLGSEYGPEVVDAIRSFVPPWSRDSQLAVTDIDKKSGKVRFVDLSALMPQAAYMDSVMTILRSVADPNDDSWDAAIDAVQGFVGPFIDEEIVVNTLMDAARNTQQAESLFHIPFQIARHHERSDPGYDVRTKTAPASTQVKQLVYHFWRGLGPGTGLSAERFTRALFAENPEVRAYFADLTHYDRTLTVKDEAMGWAGLRFSTIDVSQSMYRMASDYVRARGDASAEYGKLIKRGVDNRARPEDVLAAKGVANKMGRTAYESFVRIISDGIRQGFTPSQLETWMKNRAGENQIAKAQREAIFRDARRMIAGQPLQAYIPVVN